MAVPRDPEVLKTRARQALESGRFRDAISHFKALAKIVDGPEARAGLGAAYRGRARELAAKGLVKEALAIGDVRRELCPDEAPDPEHFTLLISAGHGAAAVGLYRQAEKRLDANTLAGMRASLGAFYLSGGSGLDQALGPDDVVIVHGAAARQALSALCRNDDAAVVCALAEIPYRSPYRDWVRMLKALMAFSPGADFAEAEALIRSIRPDSPFAPLASAARLAMMPESDFLTGLHAAGPKAQQFAATLRGWTDARLRLWRELRRLGEPPEPKGFSAWLQRRRDAVGAQWAVRQAMSLAFDGTSGRRPHSPSLSGQLTPLQNDLMVAWNAEKHDDPWEAFAAWKGVVMRLCTPKPPAPGSGDALRIALIQRRMGFELHLLDLPAESGLGRLFEQALVQVKESLHYDPDHRPTYPRLISYCRRLGRLKDARLILDAALRKWPADVTVLGEALETALASNAFKKAAGFARQILAVDPINTGAKDQLFEAHLAHARKQYGKGRLDLAESELKAAEVWSRSDQSAVKMGLMRGFLRSKAGGGTAVADLNAWVRKSGGGMKGQLVLFREAARLKISPAEIKKQMHLKAVTAPEKDDVLAFLLELRGALDAGEDIPPPVLDVFRLGLKRAAQLPLSQGEREGACETLRRCDLREARLAHALVGLKHWPGLPVFEFHMFEARFGDECWNAPGEDLRRLEAALDRAHENGDSRTAHRLTELLDGMPFDPFSDSPVSPFEAAEELDELSENMGGLLDMLIEISPEIRELARRHGREELGEMLGTELEGDGSAGLPDIDDFDAFAPKPPRKRGARRKAQAEKPADDFDGGKQGDLFE